MYSTFVCESSQGSIKKVWFQWEGSGSCHGCAVTDACRSCYDCEVLFQSVASDGLTEPSRPASPSPEQREYRSEPRRISEHFIGVVLRKRFVGLWKRAAVKRRRRNPSSCHFEGQTDFFLPRSNLWIKTSLLFSRFFNQR